MKKSKILSAEKIYEMIMEKCNAKGQRSIENVRKMCDYCEENNIVITVKKIGQLLESNGLMPKMQTLRNNRLIGQYVKVRGKMQVVDYENKGLHDLDIEYYKNENRMLKEIIAKMTI